jgi:small nuclear ribonucleoprotein
MVPNPIEQLSKALNKTIIVKVKRNKIFKGMLKSFDMHLNILLENCQYIYKTEEFDDETKQVKEVKEITEDFDQIVLRGDNIIFLEISA